MRKISASKCHLQQYWLSENPFGHVTSVTVTPVNPAQNAGLKRLDSGFRPNDHAKGVASGHAAYGKCLIFCPICGNETVTPDLIRGPDSGFPRSRE
jgi:hypothetical protein